MNSQAKSPGGNDRWERLSDRGRKVFHDYANWLVGITWYRSIVLSLVMLAATGVIHGLPPFNLNLPFVPYQLGSPLMPMALWFVLISIVVKIVYKGQVQAEVKAAQATEVAESESLKRQVMEARLAAMQAQEIGRAHV